MSWKFGERKMIAKIPQELQKKFSGNYVRKIRLRWYIHCRKQILGKLVNEEPPRYGTVDGFGPSHLSPSMAFP